jgi:2-dehydropantoate 2-reductase
VFLTRDDVLIMAVKVQDSIAALDDWSLREVQGGGTAGTEIPLLCAQNGVEGERIALRRFARVYGICVMLPASYLAAGEIAAFGHPLVGVLTVGRYPAGSDPLVDAICADLEGAGIGGVPSTAVMRWKYAKLLANLGNALEAVVGPIEGDGALDLLARARGEGEAVLQAGGIDVASPDEDAEARGRWHTKDIPGQTRGGGSTWQSLTRGTGTVETDYLAGEIVLLGRVHGVPTPVNETLQRIAKELAVHGTPPGSVPIETLTALVDAAQHTGEGLRPSA